MFLHEYTIYMHKKIDMSYEASYLCFQKLMSSADRLTTLLQHEFLLAPPCAKVEDRLSQAFDNLVDMGLLQASVFPQVCT